VKLRGRGTITFHVFDPQFVADVLARELVVEWREHDAEAAAEKTATSGMESPAEEASKGRGQADRCDARGS